MVQRKRRLEGTDEATYQENENNGNTCERPKESTEEKCETKCVDVCETNNKKQCVILSKNISDEETSEPT